MLIDVFVFSSRRRHTRLTCDWSSDVCSSDLEARIGARAKHERLALADDARHVGLRSLRDSDWLTKCANMVNRWLTDVSSCPAIAGKGDHAKRGGRGAGLNASSAI